MLKRGLIPPLLLALWTLFVWGGRLRNLNADPGGFSEASRWSLGASIVFAVLGLLLLGSIVGGMVTAKRLFVSALAAVTTVVWLVRATDIALGDHTVGFIAVHVALAVVSIGLAVLSVFAVRRSSSENTLSSATEPGRASVR